MLSECCRDWLQTAAWQFSASWLPQLQRPRYRRGVEYFTFEDQRYFSDGLPASRVDHTEAFAAASLGFVAADQHVRTCGDLFASLECRLLGLHPVSSAKLIDLSPVMNHHAQRAILITCPADICIRSDL
jgi:hypothetical protein